MAPCGCVIMQYLIIINCICLNFLSISGCSLIELPLSISLGIELTDLLHMYCLIGTLTRMMFSFADLIGFNFSGLKMSRT